MGNIIIFFPPLPDFDTMQETWTFDFPKSADYRVSLLNLLEENSKALGIFLSYYYKKVGAVAEKVTIKSGPEFESKTAGKLILKFDLVHFNACLAIHEKAKEEMKIMFEIDEANHIVKLIGAYWPERGMDEI